MGLLQKNFYIANGSFALARYESYRIFQSVTYANL